MLTPALGVTSVAGAAIAHEYLFMFLSADLCQHLPGMLRLQYEQKGPDLSESGMRQANCNSQGERKGMAK